jgi:hypothetical protein
VSSAGTSGCQRARSRARSVRAASATARSSAPGDRAQRALRAAGRGRDGGEVDRRPGHHLRARALGHQRHPRAHGRLPASSASRPARARAAARGRRRATGSTSRTARSPSPRSAVSARPSGTVPSVPGMPATRWARSSASASIAASVEVRPASQAVAQAAKRPARRSCTPRGYVGRVAAGHPAGDVARSGTWRGLGDCGYGCLGALAGRRWPVHRR